MTDKPMSPEALEARRAYQRAWNKANRDKVNEYQRDWREKHREAYLATKKRYRETHKEEIKAQRKAYWERKAAKAAEANEQKGQENK